MEDKRIADYFVIAGVPPQPRTFDLASSLPPVTEPITDLAVIIRSNSEPVPKGFICIEETPTGHKADLNHGSIRSPSVFLCIKRGRDRPPLVDVGVFYDDGKERVIPQCRVIRETPSGFPANVNNSGTKTFLTYRRLEPNAPANQLVVTDIVVILSNKGETPPHAFMLIEKNLNKGMFGSDVYLCYKKSMDRPPFIAFPPVIVDRFPLADHASFSLSEHLPNFCLPMGATVECWPATAARPSPAPSTFILTQNSGEKVYASLLNFYEPVSSPAELTRPELKALGYIEEDFPDEEEVVVVPVNPEKNLQQIKSICLLSHWPFFDQFKRFLLFLYKTFCSTSSLSSSSIPPASTLESYIFHFMRDIPFPSPERPNILVNLCNVRGGGGGGLANGGTSDHLPIQETTLLFTQTFDDLPIPSNGASFRRMLFNLGPENCLHALLFALTEQKILLHSLRPSVLTEVAEAITTIIFPLNWHCPYIPMCPMSMSQYLHAPLPFIFGIDSRYFDYFLPPSDVASIDIDTKAIYLSESKRHLNMKMLPRKETKQLRAVLETIYERFRNGGPYDFSTITFNRTTDLNARRKLERQIETEIQEAFLVFMASILRDFRHYLKPITAAPSVGATDPGSLFDLAGFVASRHPATQPFYEALTRTQMFTKFIEERSLVSDKNVSLAFFDECVEKVERWERAQRSKVNSGSTGSVIAPLSLLTDGDDGVNGGGGGGGCGGGSSGEGNKTVFITIPEHSVPSTPTTTTGGMNGQENGVERSLAVKQSSSKLSDKFGPFDHQRFYRLMKEHASSSRSPFQLAEGGGGGSLGGGDGVDQPDSVPLTNYSNSTTTTTTSELATYMFARRAKHEIRKAQRTAALARRQSPVEWAKHLLLNAYSLWFTHFPAYSHLLMQESKMKRKKTTPVKPLSLAYQVLQRMQALSVRHPDEFCYRILMILCGIHSQPALAVKVFLDMQRHQVRLNAITYGYYNKAVLEGNWPGTGTGGNEDDEESGGSPFGRALLKWAKLRNTVRVVFHLSRAHINKRSSKEEAEEEEEKRVKRNLLPLFSTAAAASDEAAAATSEGQTSRERSTSGCSSSKSEQEEHKSELKSEEEEEDATDQPITTNGNAAAVHQRVVTAKEVNGVLTISVKDAAISPSSATTLNTTTATTTTTSTSSSDTSSSSLSSTSSSSSSSSSSSAAKSSSTSSEEEEATANVQPDADNDSNSTFSSRIFGTPLKEALNSSMDFFSPKSRFGLGIRSSFRIAKSFAKPTKYNLPRSSTFGPSENGGGSVKSTRPESTTSSPPRPALPRSSTLPQSFSSSSDVLNRGNGSTPLNDNSTRTLGTLPSAAATSTPSATAATDFSPFWTNKSYSALKNYANLFASSPVKLNMVSAMTTSSNYLISQIKNFAFDEDGDAGANSTMNDREEEEAMLNGFGGVDGAETEDNFELLDRYAELFTTLAEHYSTAVDSLRRRRRRKKGRNEEEETEDSSPEIVFRLWMMSATVCRFCASVLYDEEIMCQWGPEDSNLNTRCIHCHAAFPPSLTIYPQDYRSGECHRLEPISVPYLSPLVLRKELETILSGEGYGSLIRAHFLDSHPIVYWNLLWYFSRLNLPSHIPALVLTAASINSGALKGDSKAVYDHRNVSVVCLVDSEQLYSGGSTPMHWRWMRMKNEQSAANSTSNSVTTAEVPSSSSPSDGEIIPQLVEYIRSRKVITPLQYLISERSTEKTKATTTAGTRRFNSIYRELLFMAQLELPEQISSATFDKDYHEAFESLTSKEKESLDALDRPPSIGAIFCRMLFKQLELLPITTTTTT